MKKEIWKDIKGFENLYQISNYGNIRSLDKKARCKNGYRISKGKILKTYISNKGYKRINLLKNRKIKTFPIHRLVALAFLDNPNNKEQVNHINGIKTDNRVENLEWVTCKENIKHSIRSGLTNYQYKNKKLIVIFDSIKQASEMLNIDRNKIYTRVNNGKDYKGIYFKKIGDDFNERYNI